MWRGRTLRPPAARRSSLPRPSAGESWASPVDGSCSHPLTHFRCHRNFLFFPTPLSEKVSVPRNRDGSRSETRCPVSKRAGPLPPSASRIFAKRKKEREMRQRNVKERKGRKEERERERERERGREREREKEGGREREREKRKRRKEREKKNRSRQMDVSVT